jgi:hypothetical protein
MTDTSRNAGARVSGVRMAIPEHLFGVTESAMMLP